MSDKTPYELRLELLHMAHSILQGNADMKRDLLHMVHSHDLTIGEEDLPTEIKETEISVGEILSVARTLNEFISNG
jgi:hypothetical protein